MHEQVTIYHNPKCSKSREALRLLREKGVEPVVVEYLQTPLSEEGVANLLEKLGVPPHDLLRTREAPYQETGLSPQSSREEIIRAIAAHPILMERPVIVLGEKAVIGRPPEKALTLLSDK